MILMIIMIKNNINDNINNNNNANDNTDTDKLIPFLFFYVIFVCVTFLIYIPSHSSFRFYSSSIHVSPIYHSIHYTSISLSFSPSHAPSFHHSIVQ